jgi:hypothetical protein
MVLSMEGLNVVLDNQWQVTAISMTLYDSASGTPAVTSYDLIRLVQ